MNAYCIMDVTLFFFFSSANEFALLRGPCVTNHPQHVHINLRVSRLNSI